jgi:hypothetical protein
VLGQLAALQRHGVPLQQCEHQRGLCGGHFGQWVVYAAQVGVVLALIERPAQRLGGE